MTQGPWGPQQPQPWMQPNQQTQAPWQQPRTPWAGYGQQQPAMPTPQYAPQPYQAGYGQSPYGSPQLGYPQQPQAYPQQPMPAAYPQPPYGPYGQPYPGYRPPAKQTSPAKIVFIGFLVTMLIVAGLFIALIALSSTSSSTSTKPGTYQNESYEVPGIDVNPPSVPSPSSLAEASSWLTENPLYAQIPATNVRCDTSPVHSSASTAQQEKQLNETIACLMRVWGPSMKAAGYELPRPGVTLYSSKITTPCGVSNTGNAFYCMGNQQFYYATDLTQAFPAALAGKDWLPEAVIAHEFGHAVQGRSGILSARNRILVNSSSEDEQLLLRRRAEAQADCSAGLFLNAVGPALKLTPEDREMFGAFFYGLGDDVLSGTPTIIGDHGHGSTRKAWFTKGNQATGQTIGVCNTWIADSSEVI